jgi:hypothetical protein
MAAKKGHKKAGGRSSGTPNKTTKEARELFMGIMSGQVKNIEPALNKVYNESPLKYLDAVSKLLQYFIPRQTDVTSDGERIEIKLPDIIIK